MYLAGSAMATPPPTSRHGYGGNAGANDAPTVGTRP